MKHKTLLAALSSVTAAACLCACIPFSLAAEKENAAPVSVSDNGNTPEYQPEDYELEINPTGHCVGTDSWEETEVTLHSNFCGGERSFILNKDDYETVTFTAPEDMEIVSFQFELSVWDDYYAIDLYDYESFADDMMYNKHPFESYKLLTGSVSSPMNPYSVKKGETIFSATITSGSTLTQYETDIYFEVVDLMVRTPLGDVVRVSNGDSAFLKGDCSGNGVVDISDATMLQKHLAEFKNADGTPIIDETSAKQMVVCDVTGDNKITVEDVTKIQRYLAEYIEDLS